MSEAQHGLDAVRGTMNAPAFTCLLSLMNWAKLWQDLHDGKAELDADAAMAMMTTFNGIGVNPEAWFKYAPTVIGAVSNEISRWSGDPVYRAANTMPWCMLQVGAPALALASKGLSFSSECHRIIAETFTPGVSPDVPSLASVIEKVNERPAPNGVGSDVPQRDTRAPAADSQGAHAERRTTRDTNPFAGLGGNPRRTV